jgi:hypothetical protein
VNGFTAALLASTAAAVLSVSFAPGDGLVPVEPALAQGAGCKPAGLSTSDVDYRGGAGAAGQEQTPQCDKPKAEQEPDDGSEAPAPEALQAPTAPKLGKTLQVAPERGTVRVKLPGATESVPLEQAASVPFGSVLDTRAGAVLLSAAASADGGIQRAIFHGARFAVSQPFNRAMTTLRLRGAPVCATPASVFALAYVPFAGISVTTAGPTLWGRGKGRFRTRGRHGAGTVRGTAWMTADTCSGTLVRVRRGVVDVRDFARGRTVAVRTGAQYLARRP